MNTTTALTRLTAAAAAAALAVTVVGSASAASAAEADSRAGQIVRPITTPAMHRELVRESALRYVNELEVRARIAQGTGTEMVAMHGELVRESALRYVNELEVRAEMARRTAPESDSAAPVDDDLSPLGAR